MVDLLNRSMDIHKISLISPIAKKFRLIVPMSASRSAVGTLADAAVKPGTAL
jgi:hypothetical protein